MFLQIEMQFNFYGFILESKATITINAHSGKKRSTTLTKSWRQKHSSEKYLMEKY